MEFTAIDVGQKDEPGDLESVLKFADSAGFSRDFYVRLEKHYASRGEATAESEVYLARKRRERSHESVFSASYLWSWFLDRLFGYGGSVGKILMVFVGFVLVDRMAFSRGMRPQKPEYADRGYSAVWYSIDTLVPAIDLGMAKYWEPEPANTWAVMYLRFQTAVGWILVPIAIGAVSGLIR